MEGLNENSLYERLFIMRLNNVPNSLHFVQQILTSERFLTNVFFVLADFLTLLL